MNPKVTITTVLLYLLTTCPAALAESAVAEPAMTAAIALFDTGQWDAAQSALEDLDGQSPTAVTAYYLGLISEQQGDLEVATEHMEEAAEKDPANSVYHQKLGEYYGTLTRDASVFKVMGLAKKSRASFEQAVALDGSNLDARSGLISYYLQAPGIAGGSEEKAMEQAQEIFRQDSARGHYAIARVYQHQENAEAAEREYRKALALDPENGDAWMALGIFLTSSERYADAQATYRERLSKVPDDMSILYQVGRTSSISGQDLEEGRAALQRYLAEHQPLPDDPGHDWAHYRLGLILQQLGDTDAARTEYTEALALNDDHPEAGKALKKLN